jgi:NADH-quinone oxidoreductase subunit M
MGGIRTQSPRFASMFLLVLASVALPTTFNFVGSLRLIQPSQINVWFAFFRRNDYHWAPTC